MDLNNNKYLQGIITKYLSCPISELENKDIDISHPPQFNIIKQNLYFQLETSKKDLQEVTTTNTLTNFVLNAILLEKLKEREKTIDIDTQNKRIKLIMALLLIITNCINFVITFIIKSKISLSDDND